MKAQVNTLSIVLIAGIVVAMIAIAYAWGMPLIQKRTTITEFSTAQNFILSLDSKITDIANSGSGEFILDIPSGFVNVYGYGDGNPDNNSVVLEFVTDQPMITNASNVLLKTNSFGEVGVYGESEPRIITMSNEVSAASKNKMKLKLHYRELDSETKGYKIALNPITRSGDIRIKGSFDRNVVQPNNASNQGDLVLTYITLEVT